MNTNEKKKDSNKAKNPIEKVMDAVNLQQEELADVLGLSRQTLSSYGKNPETIPNKVVKSLMLYSGLSYDELFLNNDSTDSLAFLYEPREDKYVERAGEAIERIINNKKIFVTDYLNVPKSLKKKALDEIALQQAALDQAKEKIRVVIIGSFCVGKSTLTNYMLGQKLSPTSAQGGAETLPIVYKSKSDIAKDSEVEAITSDETHTSYVSGQALRKMLSESCEQGEKKNREVTVYTEADLLNDVVLIDFPAISNLDRAWYEVADYVLASDIIVFVTTAYTGINTDELLVLKSLIERGVDINRLIIVKNKACLLSKKMKEEKKLGISNEAQRIAQTLDYSGKNAKALPTKEELEKRICYMDCLDPYSEELRKQFAELFGDTVRHLAFEREHRYFQKERDWCDDRIKYYGEQMTFASTLAEKDAGSALYNEGDADKTINASREKLRNIIDEKQNQAVKKLKKRYNTLFNEQNIEKELLQNGARAKKEYVKVVSYRLVEQLREELNKQYNIDYAEVWDFFEKTVEKTEEALPGLKSDMEYDALRTKYALKSTEKMYGFGLLNSASIGSSTGELETIMVSALAAGATTGTAAGLAALPLLPTLIPVVGMAIATGAAVGRAGTWEKRVARNIVNSFEENGFIDRIERDMTSAYEQLYALCDFLSDVTDLIQKESDTGMHDTDQSATTAKVMLCQSMVEMYYSIKAIVGAQ